MEICDEEEQGDGKHRLYMGVSWRQAPGSLARHVGGAARTSTSLPRGCPRVEAMLAIALLRSQKIDDHPTSILRLTFYELELYT